MIKPPDIPAEMSKAWRLLTAPLRTRPVFLMPGAPKCGSSSLFDALLIHPLIRRGPFKEPASMIHYPGSELRLRMNFPLRMESLRRGRFLCGDASMEYWFHPDMPSRAAGMMPDAKVIFIFREPVARAWSEYRMFRNSGRDREDFTETVRLAIRWLRDPDAEALCRSALRQQLSPLRYVRCGMYAELLEAWWEHFPRGQTVVLFLEDLLKTPQDELGRAWRLLGLDPVPITRLPHARDGGVGEAIPAEARALLEDFFRPLDHDLESLLGRSLPWR